MLVSTGRRIMVWSLKGLVCRFALGVLIAAAVLCMTSPACAGGVYLGFGVDASPGYSAPAPDTVYTPPVVVNRTPPPPPVVVQRTPPPVPVVVDRTPPPVIVERVPAVVYEQPVVVERRATVYYYRPCCTYRSYHVETTGEYYRQRNYQWDDDGGY